MLAFSAGCLLALFRHPIYGLVTYVSLIYLHPPSAWWSFGVPSLRWSLLAAGITLVSVLIHNPGAGGPRVISSPIAKGFVVLIVWLGLQSMWAMDSVSHRELLVLTIKYGLLIALIYRCIDSITHLKYFLWSHAGGCFYLGIVVIQKYVGGRFEGFSGPGIDEANAAALQIATGVIVTFALFLSGKWYEKATAFGFMPITLNALVATISRSGFLALGVAGILFNIFAPKKTRRLVRVLSVVGGVLFIMITNPTYWERIGTIMVATEQIEGVSTGTGRLALMDAQFDMFLDHPLGCGHRCTASLSAAYLDDEFLAGKRGERQARSSHNTFLALLVEQGILGGMLYLMMLIWIARKVFRLREPMCNSTGLLANTYAATVAILGAITVGDLFVDYLKFETRIWFLAMLMVIDRMEAAAAVQEPAETVEEIPARTQNYRRRRALSRR